MTYAVVGSPRRHAGARRDTERAWSASPTRTSAAALDRGARALAGAASPRILEAPAKLDAVRRELDEYFARRRTEFDLPIDWSLYGAASAARSCRRPREIPFGRTCRPTAQVAAQAGNPKASRAAGRALGANPIPIVVPCHRVVGASGKLTGYAGGLHRKEALLALEGARV